MSERTSWDTSWGAKSRPCLCSELSLEASGHGSTSAWHPGPGEPLSPCHAGPSLLATAHVPRAPPSLPGFWVPCSRGKTPKSISPDPRFRAGGVPAVVWAWLPLLAGGLLMSHPLSEPPRVPPRLGTGLSLRAFHLTQKQPRLFPSSPPPLSGKGSQALAGDSAPY